MDAGPENRLLRGKREAYDAVLAGDETPNRALQRGYVDPVA